MSSGFYELVGVPPDADTTAIRAAYQETVAQVVRKIRAAEARQADTAPLEARRAAVAEAFAVLSDPSRRRLYDRFLELSGAHLPTDLDELWRVAGPSMVPPAASAALEVVRTLTTLRVGDGLGEPVVEVEPELELEPTSPSDSVQRAGATATPSSTPNPAPAEPPAPVTRSRQVAAPAVPIDRSIAVAEVSRLLDVYGPTGAYLVALREARRLDLDGLSTATRIASRFIVAMEAENWGALPGATFVRGYLRMILRALETPGSPEDVEELVEGYMARYHRARG